MASGIFVARRTLTLVLAGISAASRCIDPRESTLGRAGLCYATLANSDGVTSVSGLRGITQ